MRLVTVGGTIKWRNNKVSLPANLVGEYVGVVDDADDSFRVIFGNLQLGRIDAETNSFTPEVKWVDDT
jgi:hypothetical protein